MVVQGNHGGSAGDSSGPDQSGGRRSDAQGGARNTVIAAGASGLVQAGTINGGIHHHDHAALARPVPRQLPPVPHGFAGRADHLADLDRRAGVPSADTPPDVVVISAIGGAGGIGKTWLALTWAHRNLHRFPDGQLFVDLHGFSPAGRPTEPADAVRGFLDALGVDLNRLPPDPDAQAALYRGLVSGRRMLILLDNAATAEQVVPLLPGTATCTVLVTGRTTLPSLIDRYGARHLPLDVLTRVEARVLLTGRLGERRVAAEPEVTDELVELCGRHPLALAITARHAATRPGIPLAEVAAELRELGLEMFDHDTDAAASLPTVLSWSLRHLTAPQRIAFALLGIAPGPDIDLSAAASLTGLSSADARKALRTLEENSLLDRRPRGRYRMHDLVRAYATVTATDTLPEPVRRAALERVVDFYRHTAHAADHHLYPHRTSVRFAPPAPGTHIHPLPDLSTALAWLDTHHAHLLAALHIAALLHHRTVLHLAWTMTTFHRRRGHRHDDLRVWQVAERAVHHLADPATRTLVHRFLGRAHAGLGQHEEAVDHLQRALAIAESHHDFTQQAHIHMVLARAWERRGDDRRALTHARLALDVYGTLDQPVWDADALNLVGWYSARLGDHETAREHCQAAFTLFSRHHDLDGEAVTSASLGYIDHRTGHYHRAIHYHRQAHAMFSAGGNSTEAADVLDCLGHSHQALGEHAEARAAWRQALELYRQQGRTTDAECVRRRLDDLATGG